MNTIIERLKALRQEMAKMDVQAYIVPTSDFHDTEYVCDYFKSRSYISGFSGSAGVVVVCEDCAALWTDGRYFIQAAKELEGTGITLMKQGVEGTPSIEEYIVENLKAGQTVGFDGRTISTMAAKKYKNVFGLHDIKLSSNMDLVGKVWADRPALPATETFHYDEKYCGKTIAEKLADVREAMKKEGAKEHIITKIDEVAWLYNLRAHDIPSFPVALAYTIVGLESSTLYINQARLDDESKKLFAENNVIVKDYDAIYEDVKSLAGPVLVCPEYVNCTIYWSLNCDVIEAADPVILMKAMKNEVELENTREAHLKDATACIKFMYWLKKNIGKIDMTEISAEDYLQELRAQQEGYIEDSFSTISAYRGNAAMMHYHADRENPVPLAPEGMLLVDSGGHYLEGTTDITRTYVLGPVTEEEKFWFTKALRGHIRLERAKFLYGCRGYNLDILTRGPLWELGMDYQCGTGHGVGHLLSVHEAPNGFRWRVVPERNDSCVLEEGMIQSNEPGVYEEGKFGIRHENEMVVRKAEKNKYGQFMDFECITFVPFDLDGIDKSIMMADEIEWLNEYHKQVYEKVADRLTEEEAAWLKEATRAI